MTRHFNNCACTGCKPNQIIVHSRNIPGMCSTPECPVALMPDHPTIYNGKCNRCFKGLPMKSKAEHDAYMKKTFDIYERMSNISNGFR